MSIKLKAINSKSLNQEQKENMWSIYKKYYDCEQSFFMDRLSKHNYFILFSYKNRIVGFIGIMRIEIRKQLLKTTIVGMAITAVEKAYRSQGFVQKAVVMLYKKELKRNLFGPIYLWSVAASYKPYLVFAKGMKSFYPKANLNVSEKYISVKRAVCKKFFTEYDLEKNLVYIQGFKVTDCTVEINEVKNKKDLDKDLLYYIKLYLNGRAISGREIKGVLIISKLNIYNFSNWILIKANKSLKKLTSLSNLKVKYV